MNYPPNYGYPPPRPPPPSGPNVLLIVLIVLIVALVLGGGGCLLCIGIAASTAEPVAPSITTTAATATAPAIAATPPPLPTVVPPLTAPSPVAPRAPIAPTAKKRTIDFVCPPGKKAGGAVRAGCLCGDEILGSACGAPGNFTAVSELPNGCRFVCN